jgi:hypothetical protein
MVHILLGLLCDKYFNNNYMPLVSRLIKTYFALKRILIDINGKHIKLSHSSHGQKQPFYYKGFGSIPVKFVWNQ